MEEEFTTKLEQVKDYTFEVTFDKEEFQPLTMDEPKPLGTETGPNAARILSSAVGHCLSESLILPSEIEDSNEACPNKSSNKTVQKRSRTLENRQPQSRPQRGTHKPARSGAHETMLGHLRRFEPMKVMLILGPP
jgi:hypothetical protein